MGRKDKARAKLFSVSSSLKQKILEPGPSPNRNNKLEELFQHSNGKFRNLLEEISDGIAVTVDGKNCWVNKAFSDILGYTKEELIGQGMEFFIIAEEIPLLLNQMPNLISGNDVLSNYETVARRKDGKRITIDFSAKRIVFEKKQALQIVIKDITERNEFVKSILKSNNDWIDTFNTINDAITIHDKDFNIIRANKAAEKVLGLSSKEIFTRKCYELYHGSDCQHKHCPSCQTLLSGKSSVSEFFEPHLKKSLEVKALPQIDEDKNVFGIVHVVRDITEQKCAVEQLKKTRDFLESVIEGSMDGIVVSDEKGYITSVNHAAEKIYELSKEEMIGKHASSLVVADKVMKEKTLNKMKELFEKGFVSYEGKHKTKNRGSIDVECSTSLIKDDRGECIAGVSIIRDISGRKKMEQQLLQAEKLRSLGELAGGVAHDFNNMLAAVLGRVQLLRGILEKSKVNNEKRKSVQELKRGFDVIEKATMDGAETVRRIQEFSRKRDDDKYFTETDVNKTLEDTIEFTSVRWKGEAEQKGIKIYIHKELAAIAPVEGSAAELREVFTNLINNAIDAMPVGGEITIGTFLDNSNVVITIKDTGIGIPKLIRDRIFEPFFTTKGVKSTGLGMSVSYGIINRHKGTITVNSRRGEGTIFTIRLPVSKGIEQNKRIKQVQKAIKKVTILVIDDEQSVRELLLDILTEEGHMVEAASDGNEGIGKFKEKEFDMVFTDLGMPGISGWRVAEEVKKVNGEVPVALITGWEVNLDDDELKNNGVDLVVNKPFCVDQIQRLVHKALAIREDIKNI